MPVYAEQVLTRGGLRTTRQEQRRRQETAYRRDPYGAMRRGLYDRAGLQPGRPKERTQEEDYRDYVRALLGRADIDLTKPETLEGIRVAARRFAGFDLDGDAGRPALADPYAQTQARLAKTYAGAGMAGKAKMATMRAARLEEMAPRREAVRGYRERLLAGQRARSAVFAKEREAAGGPIGTITTPEGVVIPERMYEQRQLEKRFPLGGSPAEAQARTGIETRRRRVEEIRAELGRTPPEEAGRLTLRGDISVPDERKALREEREKLEREIGYLERPSAAPRPGERPTIRAHEYAAKTLPLMRQQRALEAKANRIGQRAMDATDPREKARLWGEFRRAQSAATAMQQRVEAGPQAPGAVALGVEQAEIQAGEMRRAPEMAAIEKRMLGASRAAVEAARARQTVERARREAAAVKARRGPTLALKPEAVSPAARLSREKWEREIKTTLPKPVQSRLDSLEKIINPPIDPTFGAPDIPEEQKEKALKDYENILRRLEDAGRLPKGTAGMLVERADINQVADDLAKTLGREPTEEEVEEEMRKRGGAAPKKTE